MPIPFVSSGEYYAPQNKKFKEPIYSTAGEEGETMPEKSLPEGDYKETRPRFIS
jgi:hypothetical protein